MQRNAIVFRPALASLAAATAASASAAASLKIGSSSKIMRRTPLSEGASPSSIHVSSPAPFVQLGGLSSGPLEASQ